MRQPLATWNLSRFAIERVLFIGDWDLSWAVRCLSASVCTSPELRELSVGACAERRNFAKPSTSCSGASSLPSPMNN